MKIFITNVTKETSQLMALNKEINYQRLVGLLLDEWVATNLKVQVPAQTS